MRSLGEVSSRLAHRASVLAETRRGIGVVFVAALGVWWLEALFFPLAAGRDLGTYLGAYAQLFQSDPIDLGFVLGRTPLSPLIVGGLLDVGGGVLAEPVLSLLYAASVTAWFLAARSFGTRAGVLTAVVLLVYPGYGLLFHELSSDALFAAAFAGWCLLAVRFLRRPSAARIALLGAGVGLLVLVRPGSQVLIGLAPLALVLQAPWRVRLTSAFVFVFSAVAVIGALAVYNGLRYDDFTVVRGGNSGVPFYRTFVIDRIVRPGNGPASRELAHLVRRELLPREPYRSYGITLKEFFEDASPRMHVDLVSLSNRFWGWKSDSRKLRDAGLEAVRTHPGTYTRGVATTVWQLLRHPLVRTVDSGATEQSASSGRGPPATIVVDGRRLPRPTEGEPIPSAHEGGVSTPDYSIRTVWTSPTAHHLVFDHPGDERRYHRLQRRIDDLLSNLPDRAGYAGGARMLNRLSRSYPPPIFWLMIGLVVLAFRRRPRWLLASIPTLAALLVVGVTALAVPASPQYSIPVVPSFFLLVAAALFAPRREHAEEEARVALGPFEARSRALGGAVVGALCVIWAVAIYVGNITDAFQDNKAPHDLEVFLRGAAKVVHGTSPYIFRGDQTYAYPPLLAFLVSPLHWLGAAAATLIWTLVSLAAIGAGLWLLGVRDWRCYALTAAYPFTKSAVSLGTVGPLLFLALAAAWRWREQLLRSGAAAGLAVALKLFLWPLVFWLALTRRLRGAAAAVAVAMALIFVSWAAIGFAGLGDYPGIIRRLADDEAMSSYSVVALGVRAHLPEAAARVIAAVVAVGLLVAAALFARDERRTRNERDVAVLTLALAAALAASPIVWMHYFLLLLVPVALTRPRLSPLWLVPFAYYPLGETAWPTGDARKLGLALVTTIVILVATVRPFGPTRLETIWRRATFRRAESPPDLRPRPR